MNQSILTIMLMSSIMIAAERTAYIGTYTKPGGSKGIYMLRLDEATGKMSAPELVAETPNPSYVTLSKGSKFLYAVTEAKDGDVSAFAIEAGGKLRFLNKVKAKGDAPCHLNIDKTGKWLAVANYSSGSTAVFPLTADGKLGDAIATVQHKGKSVNRRRQEGPHAHSADFSADNKYLFVSDLGTDEVQVYAFDEKSGAITQKAQLETPKGAGPRHLALGKNGFVYVLGEMGSNVSVFKFTGQPKGELLSTTSAIPADFKAETNAAEIVLHPKGTLLFSSNRGHDSISIFRVDPATGAIKLLGQQPVGGKIPRGFDVSPDGNFLLAGGQNTDNIFSFRIDLKEGKLIPVAAPVSVGSPVCIRFVQ